MRQMWGGSLSERRPTRVLVDMDGVLADFERGFERAWNDHFPNVPRTVAAPARGWKIIDRLVRRLGPLVKDVVHAPGFFAGLPPLPGALVGVREMRRALPDLWICTRPQVRYENCVPEKYAWVQRHLGREWTRRIVVVRDKTIVDADWLIDDDPTLARAIDARWRLVLFDAPYNRGAQGTPRMTWLTWRDVLRPVGKRTAKG
jgi:5'-nucleotidase